MNRSSDSNKNEGNKRSVKSSSSSGSIQSISLTVPPIVRITPPDTVNANEQIIYRLVLTGGPCSGKTTGQVRLCTFFASLGWKVFCVPEMAATVLNGGVRFHDLDPVDSEKFQKNLIKLMIATERTFFTLAYACKRQNCLVICDRGLMDATAYMSADSWRSMMRSYGWNMVELRDNRYNQVCHLVTAADGAEQFYEMNQIRTENRELARELDRRTMQAWVGHPCIDVIDNSTDFNAKMRRLIAAVCRRIGIEAADRLESASRKVKYLIRSPLPADAAFPPYQDFDIVHDYLLTRPQIMVHVRRRGQNDHWIYQRTTKRSFVAGEPMIELRRQITRRHYEALLAQRDQSHETVRKLRRCFLWQKCYFQLDIYRTTKAAITITTNGRDENINQDLMILETYTTLTAEQLRPRLPPFLDIVRDVTDECQFSMFNISLKKSDAK